MLTRKWTTWLGILLGLAAVGGGLYALLATQGMSTGANIVAILATIALGAWSLRGLYVWREVTWVRRINSFVIAVFVFGLIYLVFRATGLPAFARGTLYIFGTVAGFMLGINLLRLALMPGGPVLGTALTTLEEAIRLKLALIFIVALLTLLPALVFVLAGDDRLTYVVQRFLTYALILVSFLLSNMTVILAGYTTSNDLKSKMVHMSLTKPIGRTQFILGKWIGVVLLNAVLLAVSGIAIAGFATTLADGKAMNEQDKEEVHKEVLTARLAQIPSPVDGTFEDMVDRTLRNRQDMDPDRYGELGTPASALQRNVYLEVETEALTDWFTIDASDSESDVTTYRFTGLEVARDNAQRAAEEAHERLVNYGLTAGQAQAVIDAHVGDGPLPDVDLSALMTRDQFLEIVVLLNSEKVQLTFNPYSRPEPEDGMVVMRFTINGQPYPIGSDGYVKVAVDAPQEMALPAWLIEDDGTLLLTVHVPRERPLGDTGRDIEQASVQLNRKDAIPEIFYRVGSFEANLARTMVVLWVRLAFLAMFGLILGSLFSFPIACMAGILVYVIAAFSGFLSEAVSDFTAVPEADSAWGVVTGAFGGFFNALGNGEFVAALKLLVGLFAKLVMMLIPSFGEFNPGPALADGKIVPNSMIYSALFRIGLLWTGLITVLGLLLFHRRELARVTV